MGLLFNRKSSLNGKRQFNNNRYVKRIADAEITKYDIHHISKEVGLNHPGARHHLAQMLKKDQIGGLTREEVHNDLQTLIAEGYVTKNKAREVAKELGLRDKRFRKFKDLSELRYENGSKEMEAPTEKSERKIVSISFNRQEEARNANIEQEKAAKDGEKKLTTQLAANKSKLPGQNIYSNNQNKSKSIYSLLRKSS